MVHNLGVGLVEAGSQVGLGHGQAHGIADALTQGACNSVGERSLAAGNASARERGTKPVYVAEAPTGGHLHAGRDEVLGVARGLGAPLAELLQVIELRGGGMGGAQRKICGLIASNCPNPSADPGPIATLEHPNAIYNARIVP